MSFIDLAICSSATLIRSQRNRNSDKTEMSSVSSTYREIQSTCSVHMALDPADVR